MSAQGKVTWKRGSWRLRVTYADTDQARIVHHASYLRYLEIARLEFMRENGFDYDRFEKDSGCGLPLAEANLRYRSPARFDDLLDIESWVIAGSRASMRMGANVYRVGASGEPRRLLCETTVRLACAHLGEGTIRSMPPALLEALSEGAVPAKARTA